MFLLFLQKIAINRAAYYVVGFALCMGIVLVLFDKIDLIGIGFVLYVLTPTLLEKFTIYQDGKYPRSSLNSLKSFVITIWIVVQVCNLIFIGRLICTDALSIVNVKQEVHFVTLFVVAGRAFIRLPIYGLGLVCWLYVIVGGIMKIKNFDYQIAARIKSEVMMNNY